MKYYIEVGKCQKTHIWTFSFWSLNVRFWNHNCSQCIETFNFFDNVECWANRKKVSFHNRSSDLADQKPQKCKNLNIIRFVFKYTDHEGGERTTDAGYESLRIFNTCKSDFLWRPFCLVILHNGLVIHQNYNLDNNFKLNSWKEKKRFCYMKMEWPLSWTFSKILRNILQFF